MRFIDIPASDPDSSGIFDGDIKPAPGKTLRETTKEIVESLKVNAIKHQGHAFRALMEKYVNDPDGLETLKKYKEQFERDAELPDGHNAYYRVRSNFAVMYAGAALAIDYEILPWKKGPTFRAVEKCMRLALATSKWSRVCRYAADYKDLNEPLRDFVKRRGGLNKCAGRYARRLGRGARTGD